MNIGKLTPEEVRIIDIALAELNSGLGIEAEIVWEEAGLLIQQVKEAGIVNTNKER
jgi:hypothetical protein